MADKRWVSTDGNLSTAASYSPSGVPTVGDSLFFDGSSQMDVVSGLTAFSAFDMTQIWTQSPYRGDIGADGNPLTAQVRWLIHQGSGSLFHAYKSHTSQAYVVIDSPNLQDAYTLVSTNGAAGVNMTLACLNGGIRILDNATSAIGTLLVGGKFTSRLPIVNIGLTSGVVTYRQTGGTVTTKTPLGISTSHAIIDGGTLVYDAGATDDWAWMEIAGGYVQYNSAATLTRCTVSSGTLDMMGDSRAKTITTLTLLPGSRFLTHKNVTVGTLIDLRESFPILP
ncbi:MAG: hypothetical protein V1790_06010 [Planctomycetota bacterium]